MMAAGAGTGDTRIGAAAWALVAALRLGLFALLWFVLSEGAASAWIYATVLVPVATAVSLVTLRPRRWDGSPVRRGWAAVCLGGWFIWQSLRGGADVAVRSLRRTVAVDPVRMRVPVRLTSRRARVLLADISSLTPGSLTVDLVEDALEVHVLHREIPVRDTVARLERLVAAVFGEELPPAPGPSGQVRR